jgi:Na+-transporting methylmalonyl-CoA/oxaloacetate decarboxylase gamma subunit
MLEGLRIAVVGMAWVFAGLALIWVLIALLNRFFPGKAVSGARTSATETRPAAATPTTAVDSEALTAERAQVAAIVAAALHAGALPIHPEAPAGPAFEHGRTAPTWVSSNRARALQSWQPPRRPGD